MIKYLIAVPCMDTCPVQFAYSLATLRKPGAWKISMISGAAVHEARNTLAQEAVDSGADRVLWIDSDMQFAEDLAERLAARLDEGWDMVCGIYTKRRLPVTPVIYSDIRPEDGRAEVYADYPRDNIFPIAGCGFGAVMMSTALIRAVQSAYGLPFNPLAKLGEDLSFCWRATMLGAKIGCDSRVKVGHVGQIVYGEAMYAHPNGGE